METFIELVKRIAREDEGQDMVEYALILGLISIIAVVAVTTTGTQISAIWTKVANAVTTAAGGA